MTALVLRTPAVRHVALLLLLAGCGAASPTPDGGNADAGPHDAGEEDAGVDAGLELRDWRTTRGAPFKTSVIGEYRGAAFALGDGFFALATRCDGGACDYEWRDDAGAVTTTRANLRSAFDTAVSPDRRLLSMVSLTSAGACTNAGGFSYDWLRGAWQLIDLSGTVVNEQPDAVVPLEVGAAFLRHGRHVRFSEISLSNCERNLGTIRSTFAPFQTPQEVSMLPASAWVDDELAATRLLTSWGESIAIVDLDSGALERVSDGATERLDSGSFVHAFTRHFVEAITSYELTTRAAKTTAIPNQEDDFTTDSASHRYAVVCASEDMQLRRRCLVVDGRAEHPRADLRVGRAAGRRQLAVAGREDFLVYVDGAATAVVRRDLRSGAETALGLPPGRLRAVGDGRAVLLTTSDSAWAIERDQVVRFEGRLVAALSAELSGARPELPQSQLVLVVSANASGSEHWLTAWHVGQRRLVRLTDSVSYNPPFNAPFTAATDCAAPGFVRTVGAPADSIVQRADLLHFTEFVPSATPKLRVFVMPIDLSAPPRLLAELDAGRCAPPLAAISGRRLWLPVPTPAGLVRAVFAE